MDMDVYLSSIYSFPTIFQICSCRFCNQLLTIDTPSAKSIFEMSSSKQAKVCKSWQVWYTYCPDPEKCTKGTKSMSRSYSRETAEKVLINHLVESPFHKLSSSEAERRIKETPNCITGPFLWEEEEEEPQKDQLSFVMLYIFIYKSQIILNHIVYPYGPYDHVPHT